MKNIKILNLNPVKFPEIATTDNTNSYLINRFNELEKLITENELLKANLRTAAIQLRSGVSKIQQKTMARVIEQMLNESN